MAEYLEREAFKAVLVQIHKHHANNGREVSLLERDIRLLMEQPAADVAPVVRGKEKEFSAALHSAGGCYCRECEKWHEQTGWCNEHSHFISAEGWPCTPAESNDWKMFSPDDFCSYGRRKNEGGVSGGADCPRAFLFKAQTTEKGMQSQRQIGNDQRRSNFHPGAYGYRPNWRTGRIKQDEPYV